MIWVRAAILCVIIGVAVVGLTQAPAAPSDSTPAVAAVEPTPPLTRVPLPTAPPQIVISRIARETPAPRATPTPPPEPGVALVDNGYLPVQLTVRVGSNVTWLNTGSDGHDVTGNGPGGPCRSGPLAPAERYQRQFSLVGSYEYACSIHPEMRGRLVVQP